MTSSSKQKQKTIALLRLLQTQSDIGRGLTMAQIIEHLGRQGILAERKSIYRDIEALRSCGYDVVKLPTRPVQYALDRGTLGLDDVMMLVDAVQSSRFLSESQSDRLVGGLKQLVSERQRDQLQKRVHVQGRVRNQSESVFHSVDVIHQALRQKRQIEFLYFSYDTHLRRQARHGGKRYRLTPVKVMYAEGNYYLAAFDQQDELIKTYRIDRMELPQVFDAPAVRNAQIATYETAEQDFVSFGMFHGDAATVTLRVRAQMMDAVVDKFGQAIEVVKAAEEFADVRVAVQLSPQFFGWVAGLEGAVKIVAPQRTVRAYRQWLFSLAENA